MSKYYICISRYIINSVLHFVCRSFCFRINAPFVLEITAIQKICASENYNGYDHHCDSVHNINSLSFVFFIHDTMTVKQLLHQKTPLLSFRITKAECSVVPLCIIIPVTRYNLLTLSESNSFSCNVKTTSRLTIDFSGMLPGDITKHHLPHLTCLRLSVIRFLL